MPTFYDVIESHQHVLSNKLAITDVDVKDKRVLIRVSSHSTMNMSYVPQLLQRINAYNP